MHKNTNTRALWLGAIFLVLANVSAASMERAALGDLLAQAGDGIQKQGDDAKQPKGNANCGDLFERACVPLIEPLGPHDSIPVGEGAQTIITYFNDSLDLILSIAVGICVLWILIGGYFIMISGSDSGKRSTGKSIITWALIGLVILTFAGFFLRTLNSIFFV